MTQKLEVSGDEVKVKIDAAVDKLSSQLREANTTIWKNPELAYEEHIAHDTLCNVLKANGFQVTHHAWGLDTSFDACAGSKVHCAIIETPKRSNVIADRTSIAWQMRAPKMSEVQELTSKICSCLQAGALATGCTLDMQDESAYADLLINDTICELYRGHMAGYGQKVLHKDPNHIFASTDFGMIRPVLGGILNFFTRANIIGDVSYAFPAMHAMFCMPVKDKGVVTHHTSFTEAAGSDAAHDIALTVGKALALCAWDLLTADEKYEAAVSNWKKAIEE